jgi:hypothetical protein
VIAARAIQPNIPQHRLHINMNSTCFMHSNYITLAIYLWSTVSMQSSKKHTHATRSLSAKDGLDKQHGFKSLLDLKETNPYRCIDNRILNGNKKKKNKDNKKSRTNRKTNTNVLVDIEVGTRSPQCRCQPPPLNSIQFNSIKLY